MDCAGPAAHEDHSQLASWGGPSWGGGIREHSLQGSPRGLELTLTFWQVSRRRATAAQKLTLLHSPLPGAWVCRGMGLGGERYFQVLLASGDGPRGPSHRSCPAGQLISLATA